MEALLPFADSRVADAANQRVLMDLQMPVLDGIEATRPIRHDSCNRDTPMVASTAHAFGDDQSACIAAGMNEHMAKPIEARLFVRVRAQGRAAGVSAHRPAAAGHSGAVCNRPMRCRDRP